MNRARQSRFLWLLGAALVYPTAALAHTIVFPTSAIEAAWELDAEEFKQEFPGIDYTGQGLTDEGWYVRYRHENLTYFFGPVEEEINVYQFERRMHELRNDLVMKRPSLGSSIVDVVFYTYDPSRGPAGYGTGGGQGMIVEGGNGTSAQGDPYGQGSGGQSPDGQGQGDDPSGQMNGNGGQELAQLTSLGQPGGQGQGQGQQPGMVVNGGQQAGGQGSQSGSQGQQMGQSGGQQGQGQSQSQGQQQGQSGQGQSQSQSPGQPGQQGSNQPPQLAQLGQLGQPG